MFFSVVVPVYNVEKYLAQCIDSVLSQTFTDYELILVDDGSTDSSGSICDKYATIDSRIKVIHKTNGGQSSARNLGVENSNGKYLIFLDSDDFIISKEFFEVIYKESNDCDLIFYKFQKYIDKKRELMPCNFSYKGIVVSSYNETIKKMVEKDAFYGMAWIHAIRRSLVVDNQIMFEVGLKGEDMEWNYHIITNAKSVNLVERSFIAYRQRENSTTTTLKLKNLTDFIYILEKWTEIVSHLELDIEMKETLFASMAKYYSNLLVVFNRVKDKNKNKEYPRIKGLIWILRYSKSKRPKLIYKVSKLCGLKSTMLMLKFLDKK